MLNFNDFKETINFEATYESFISEVDNILNENSIYSINEGFMADTVKNAASDTLNNAAKDNPMLKAALKTKRTVAATAAGKAYKKFYLANELTPIMARVRKDKVADKDGKDSSAYQNAEKAAEMAQKKAEAIAKKMEAAKMRMKDEANGDKDIEKLISKIEIEAKEEAANKIYKIASEEQAKAEGWSKERVEAINKDADKIDQEYDEIEKRNAESAKEIKAKAEQDLTGENADKYREHEEELNDFIEKRTKFDDELAAAVSFMNSTDDFEEDNTKEQEAKEKIANARAYFDNMIQFHSKAMKNILAGKEAEDDNAKPSEDDPGTNAKELAKIGFKKKSKQTPQQTD